MVINNTDSGPRMRVTQPVTNRERALTVLRRWFKAIAPRPGRHRAASQPTRADKTLITPASMDREW